MLPQIGMSPTIETVPSVVEGASDVDLVAGTEVVAAEQHNLLRTVMLGLRIMRMLREWVEVGAEEGNGCQKVMEKQAVAADRKGRASAAAALDIGVVSLTTAKARCTSALCRSLYV